MASDSFKRNVEKLKQYYKKHSELPKHSELKEDAETRTLRNFIRAVKQRFAENQLTTDEIDLINTVPEFFFTDQDEWMYFKELAYKKYINKKKISETDETKLARWLEYQKLHKEKLTAEQQTALLSIPSFKFKVSQDAHWHDMYEKCLDFLIREQKTPTRQDDSVLANWFYSEKKKYDKQNMKPDRVVLFVKLIAVEIQG